MKQLTFNGRVLLPMDVIEAARAGDPLALERVLRYYDRYINKICTRTLYDKDGLPYIGVDEYMVIVPQLKVGYKEATAPLVFSYIVPRQRQSK